MNNQEASDLLQDAISITISRADYLYFQRLKEAEKSKQGVPNEFLTFEELQFINVYRKKYQQAIMSLTAGIENYKGTSSDKLFFELLEHQK